MHRHRTCLPKRLITLAWLFTLSALPCTARQTPGIYVANQGNFSDNNGSILFYDPATAQATEVLADFGTLVQSITLYNGRGYVMSNTSEAVDILDLGTRQRVGQVPGVASPRYMAVVDASKAYVSNLFANTVTIINLSDNTVAGTISTGTNPEDIAVVGTRAYVANFGFGGDSTLTVIDTPTDTVLGTIDLGCDGPRHLEVDAEGEVWAFCNGNTIYNDDFTEIIAQTNGAVVVLDGATGAVVTRFDLAFQVGTSALGQDTFYVASQERVFLIHGTDLLVFDTEGNAQEAPITLAGDEEMGGIAYDASVQRFYAARITGFTTAGFVSIHNESGDEVGRFDAGIAPAHLALSTGETATAVESVAEAMPERFRLLGNYPNPFNPATTVPFELARSGHVTLTILDVLGREVATLVNEALPPGRYESTWDAGSLAGGVYLSRLAVDGRSTTRRLVLIK
ncbi:MAG: DUF5074 domain-containing protein [Rhodothermales bacterium]